MNIFGLNQMVAFPEPAKGQGGGTSRGESSFEDVLGQVQTDQGESDVVAWDAESAALPAQPNNPVLENPLFSERLLPGPNEMTLVNPMTKPAVAMVKDEEGVDSLTRRAVWSSFLRKMKDELGVSAEDVLSAFDSLSAEDLAKPPQQTVDKVVMALGLDPQQTQVAKQHFMDLIDRTQARSLGEEITNSEKQISLTLMSQRELDRKAQNKAIDSLNQNFFMKGPFERPANLTQESSPVPQQMPQAGSPVVLDDGQSGMILPKDMQPVAANTKPGTVAPKVDVDGLIKKFMQGQASGSASASAPAVVAASTPMPVETATQVPSPASTSIPAPMQALFAPPAQSADAEADFGDDQQFTRDASYLASGLGMDGQSRGVTLGQAEFQQQLNVAAPMQQMSVPDLVQNAQVMVRDGGGEMKVTLTPDGLGEVAMKVAVKDGKVNVQMITESDEAKRLIERGLADLKTQLAQNQLQVTDIKIDTASNLGKQLEQQYSDAQRQMAQQTLEQFRQDHQGWRRSFFEVPGAKVYKNQADAPRDAQAPTSVAARNRAGSRRLDLVA